MTPFTWFSLALRVIEAWTAVQSAQMFIYAFNHFKSFDTTHVVTPVACLNQGVGYIVLGVVLIKLAPVFASFAYPRANKCAAEADDANESTT
jgi:hypothetical protein